MHYSILYIFAQVIYGQALSLHLGSESPTRHQQSKRRNVGLQQDNHTNDTGEYHTVPYDVFEDIRLSADLFGGGGGDADRLGINHFAHHAACRVCDTDEDGTEAEL